MALHIFLIEDDEATRVALTEVLQGLPHTRVIGFADSEIHAVHWLSTHDRDWQLAVVDLHLKKGSGIAALQWCATRMPHQKVVVLSSMPSEAMRKRCLECGADRVFDKADGLQDLLAFCHAMAAEESGAPTSTL
jgi:two-component system, OmpR family, response regulator